MNWSVTLGLALAVGAPGVKDAPKKKAEPPAIVGEWQCVEFIGGGRLAAPKELAQIGMEFTADGKVRNRWGKDVSEGTYTTDPSKDPAHLDCMSDKNRKGGQMIYKVEDDKLIICGHDGNRGDRPTKFESPAGTRTLLLTFKRAEKKKE
jgi:uncharacterized protein (TIGR03067 family)